LRRARPEQPFGKDLDDDWGLDDAIEAENEWAEHNAAQCISEPFALSPPESMGVSLSPSRVLRGALEPSSLSAYLVEEEKDSVSTLTPLESEPNDCEPSCMLPGAVLPAIHIITPRRCLLSSNSTPGPVRKRLRVKTSTSVYDTDDQDSIPRMWQDIPDSDELGTRSRYKFVYYR